VGFAWIVLLAFLRLSTNASLFPRPLPSEDAFNVVEAWLEQPAAVILQPTARHVGLLRGLLEPLGVAANLVNDAHLAGLGLEHGAELVSFDSDFACFRGVRWRTPD
jgi:toxin-antitoxin system PIN domain toxin